MHPAGATGASSRVESWAQAAAGPLPEIGSEVGASPGPGQQGEYDFPGFEAIAVVDAAHEVAVQVVEGVEAEAQLIR